jgi:hypothetical protein
MCLGLHGRLTPGERAPHLSFGHWPETLQAEESQQQLDPREDALLFPLKFLLGQNARLAQLGQLLELAHSLARWVCGCLLWRLLRGGRILRIPLPTASAYEVAQPACQQGPQ